MSALSNNSIIRFIPYIFLYGTRVKALGHINSKTGLKGPVHELVHLIDLSWNTIEPSLILMYEKLVRLGFVYVNGEVFVIDLETEQSEYHK